MGLSCFRAISGWDWVWMGWDLCAGLFYEHRFAMLIIEEGYYQERLILGNLKVALPQQTPRGKAFRPCFCPFAERSSPFSSLALTHLLASSAQNQPGKIARCLEHL